jgi:hypothetical protein
VVELTTKYGLTTKLTKGMKGSDIYTLKLRDLRVLRGAIPSSLFGCGFAALGLRGEICLYFLVAA